MTGPDDTNPDEEVLNDKVTTPDPESDPAEKIDEIGEPFENNNA